MREKHQLVQLLALVQLLNPKCNNDVSFQLNDQRNDKIILYCSLTLGFIAHSFIDTAIGRFETNLKNSKLNDFHEKSVTFENHKT